VVKRKRNQDIEKRIKDGSVNKYQNLSTIIKPVPKYEGNAGIPTCTPSFFYSARSQSIF